LYKLSRYKEALESYDRAIELNNNTAWSNRANTLNKLFRHEEALVSCDKAIQINPNSFDNWYSHGI